MKKDYNLRPLWDAILNIYKAFAEVCDRNGLRYYATGGTALGAMRHGGFIPWDDDFDLVMPRPDYIKFMEICHKELPTHYEAIDFRHDSSYPYCFGKVRDNRKKIIEEVSEASNLNLDQGIFIDVIPIDGMPKAEIPFRFWILGRMAWRHYSQLETEPIYTRLFWWVIGKIINIPNDPQKQRIAFEKWLSKWNFDKSPAVDDYNTNARRLNHRVLSASSFMPARYVKFENIEIPVPNKVEDFLTEIYRDWQTLPPEDKQVPSHQRKGTYVFK